MSTELPRVPDAYAEYCYWRARSNETGTYGAARYCQRAREAWIDAEWRVNCASFEWTKLPAWPDTRMFWVMRKMVEQMNWQVRCAGGEPGTDLALRDKGVVA